MDFPEMIYQLTIFLFSNFWTYLGFIIIILSIRGDVTNFIRSIKEFIKKILIKIISGNNKIIKGG